MSSDCDLGHLPICGYITRLSSIGDQGGHIQTLLVSRVVDATEAHARLWLNHLAVIVAQGWIERRAAEFDLQLERRMDELLLGIGMSLQPAQAQLSVLDTAGRLRAGPWSLA